MHLRPDDVNLAAVSDEVVDLISVVLVVRVVVDIELNGIRENLLSDFERIVRVVARHDVSVFALCYFVACYSGSVVIRRAFVDDVPAVKRSFVMFAQHADSVPVQLVHRVEVMRRQLVDFFRRHRLAGFRRLKKNLTFFRELQRDVVPQPRWTLPSHGPPDNCVTMQANSL